jgi:hypothetical protein
MRDCLLRTLWSNQEICPEHPSFQTPSETIGPRLVKNRRVKAVIEARVSTTAAITTNEILARIADIATSDLMEFIDVDDKGGYSVNLKRLRKERAGHVVKRLRISKDGAIQIELEPRLPALIKLGEYFNLWNRGAEPQITMVDVAKRLKERYERLRAAGQCDRPAGSLPGPTGAVQ